MRKKTDTAKSHLLVRLTLLSLKVFMATASSVSLAMAGIPVKRAYAGITHIHEYRAIVGGLPPVITPENGALPFPILTMQQDRLADNFNTFLESALLEYSFSDENAQIRQKVIDIWYARTGPEDLLRILNPSAQDLHELIAMVKERADHTYPNAVITPDIVGASLHRLGNTKDLPELIRGYAQAYHFSEDLVLAGLIKDEYTRPSSVPDLTPRLILISQSTETPQQKPKEKPLPNDPDSLLIRKLNSIEPSSGDDDAGDDPYDG